MRSRLLFLTVLLIIICVSCRPKKKTEPEKKGFPILPVGIAVVILAGGIAAVIIVKKKKQRKLQEEEESLADEFDRLTEDE